MNIPKKKNQSSNEELEKPNSCIKEQQIYTRKHDISKIIFIY